MEDAKSKPSGWIEVLRRTGDSLLGLAQNRFEIFTVEWQEEKLRAVRLLLWLCLALTLGVAGLLIALGALALFLWDMAGYAGLAGLALAALAGATGLLRAIHHRLCHGPPPFHQTLTEFQKDRECLRRKN